MQTTTLPSPNAPAFVALASAFDHFDALVDSPTRPLRAPVSGPALRAVSTSAQGVPTEFANAWEWAAHWVKNEGVTLPPDTSETRSLRNWFCYQLQMFKKNTLSARSEELLRQLGIDLSLYRAEKTGKGYLMDDATQIAALRAHFAEHGTYNLRFDSDAHLVQWQKRLLARFVARGSSARMQAIAEQLPGFCYGLWLRPADAPIPSTEVGWWRRAAELRIASRERPSFRGKIDLGVPVHLRLWASEQIGLAQTGKLHPRQRGELLSLQLISHGEHRASQTRAVALATARMERGQEPRSTLKERDVQTFLGACLLVHLLHDQKEKRAVYRSLSLSPAQFGRVQEAVEPWAQEIARLGNKTNLCALRKIYKRFAHESTALAALAERGNAVFANLGQRHAQRVFDLCAVVVGLRDALRRANIRQDFVS